MTATTYFLRKVWFEDDMIKGYPAGGPYDTLDQAEAERERLMQIDSASQIDVMTRDGRVMLPRNSNSQ